MKLRKYQVNCASKLLLDLYAGHERLLAVLPTGCGKTVIFSSIADEWIRQQRGRVMVICPTIELVKQAAKKLQQVTKQHVAIEQGSKWSNESDWARSDFVVACKPSLLSISKGTEEPRYKRFSGVTLVVVDEAHLSITKKFADMVEWFISQGAQIVGVTATPKRSDKKSMGNVYHHSSYVMGIKEAIEDGWLVGCKTHCIQLQSLDLSEVKTQGDDFVIAQLGGVMEDEKVCFEIAAVTAEEMKCDD